MAYFKCTTNKKNNVYLNGLETSGGINLISYKTILDNGEFDIIPRVYMNFLYVKRNDDIILVGFAGEVYDEETSSLQLENRYVYNLTTKESYRITPYDMGYNMGCVVVYNDELHILGGYGKPKGHYKHEFGNWNTKVYTEVSTLPFDFQYGFAEVYNGEIHIFGGNVEEGFKHYSWNGSRWHDVLSDYPYVTGDDWFDNHQDQLYIEGTYDRSYYTSLIYNDCIYLLSNDSYCYYYDGIYWHSVMYYTEDGWDYNPEEGIAMHAVPYHWLWLQGDTIYYIYVKSQTSSSVTYGFGYTTPPKKISGKESEFVELDASFIEELTGWPNYYVICGLIKDKEDILVIVQDDWKYPSTVNSHVYTLKTIYKLTYK